MFLRADSSHPHPLPTSGAWDQLWQASPGELDTWQPWWDGFQMNSLTPAPHFQYQDNLCRYCYNHYNDKNVTKLSYLSFTMGIKTMFNIEIAFRHRALFLWEDEPARNKETQGVADLQTSLNLQTSLGDCLFIGWSTICMFYTMIIHVHGLAQDCSNSIAKALELLQSFAKPPVGTITYVCNHRWHSMLVANGLADDKSICNHHYNRPVSVGP